MRKYIATLFIVLFACILVHAQTLTTVLLPQTIEGINGTNANRIPFAYRVQLSGLLTNATYRYFNQLVISSDPVTTNGAGNCIFASATGDFVRTSSVSLATAGGYGTFTTDATGAYEGWFITEPTGNARLVPSRYIFMRIVLNDGAGGTTAVTRLTTADSVRVVKLDAGANDSTGTGLRCTSSASAKDFVFTYNNTAGTGRPVSGSFIESDGTANTTANSYSAFYANNVDGVNGAFGVVLPNTLPNGIRRVERRSFATGTVVVFATDVDGVWPSGANTVNPAGGTTEIVLTGADVNQLTAVVQSGGEIPEEFTLTQNYPNPFNPTTTIRFALPTESVVRLEVFNIIGQQVAMLVNERRPAGTYSVTFDGLDLPSGMYVYRMAAGEFTRSMKLTILK